jgi:hypothetical protein
MPLPVGFEHPSAGFGRRYPIAEKRAKSAADDMAEFVFVVVKMQGRRQCVGFHGVVHHGKTSGRIGAVYLPFYSQAAEIEALAALGDDFWYELPCNDAQILGGDALK